MCKADNLPPSCNIVTKSVKLNFLERSGPVQASNRTALHLPLLCNSKEFFNPCPANVENMVSS